MDDGCPGIKIQMIMFWVPIKAVYIEDGLDIRGWNLLDCIRFEMTNTEALK
jgi:hypothetical protein